MIDNIQAGMALWGVMGGHLPTLKVPNERIRTVGTLKLSSEEFTSFIRTIKLMFRLAF